MALKFLNKKGWHTGSLRNIENVWKAEQKHDAEQKKLEELRKQIHEERERSEFRQLQEQAGLVPKQERLEFLYESGLAVGKGSSSGVAFKALESSVPKTDPGAASSSQPQQSDAPGALFEEKPQSANDAWRKLHSDPLLLIRQKEQEALARVKNNPVRMAMIRKSVEDTKNKERLHNKDDKKSRRKHHHKKESSSKSHSGFEKSASTAKEKRKSSGSHNTSESSDGDPNDRYDGRRKRSSSKHSKHVGHEDRRNRNSDDFVAEKNYSEGRREEKRERSFNSNSSNTTQKHDLGKRRNAVVKLSDEERAAKLREMQMDAELHEDQRWKRLKKADENDAKEAVHANNLSRGKNFLDVVQKNVYGTGTGGSSTIEESVRRRTHYSQGRSEATEKNAFRR